MESTPVVCPVGFATQSLASVGKAIHEIGKEEIELHHHGVHGKNDSSLTGSCRGKEEVHRHQTECTEEDVSIDMEELTDIPEYPLFLEIPKQSAVMMYQ